MARLKTPSDVPLFERTIQYAGWALPIIVFLVMVGISSETYIKNLVTDDALYYPVIARSIANEFRSSYDGITKTNGYHPLWCWLQIPVALFTGRLDAMTYLWFIKLMLSVIVLAALFVWGKLIRDVTGSKIISATFVLLLGSYWWSIYTLYSGMETPLVVLLMGLSLAAGKKLLESPSIKLAFLLSIIVAATFLARLDSVFFLAPLGLVLAVRFKKNVRLIMAISLPAITLPVPYLIWNYWNFGNIVPVSGLKKTAMGVDFSKQISIFCGFWSDKYEKLVNIVRPEGVIFVALSVAAIIYLSRQEIRTNLKRLGIIWILPIGALMHYGYTSIFMYEADIYWYQYSEYMSVYLIMAVILLSITDRLGRNGKTARLKGVPFLMLLLGVLCVVLIYGPKKLPNKVSVEVYRAAVWARAHFAVEKSPRFGMCDSGIFRFVSGYETVSLNGLAGDRELLELVRKEDWAGIVKKYNIDYLVDFRSEEEIRTMKVGDIIFKSETYVYVKPGRMVIMRPSLMLEK